MISSRTMFLSAVSVALLSTSGCMWDRFDELRATAPLEALKVPRGQEQSFGGVLSALNFKNRAVVLVSGLAGESPAASFDLGLEEDPQLEPADGKHCESDLDARRCVTIEQSASLPRARAPSKTVRDFCFVSGIGRAGKVEGLWTRCLDTYEFAYPLPKDLEAHLLTPFRNGKKPPIVRLSTDRTEAPLLLAGAPGAGRAWYYESLGNKPIDLKPPGEVGGDYGASLAVLHGEDASVLAVGGPGASSVWLFRVKGSEVETLGCLGGPEKFGRALGAGDVDGDGAPDLVVSDASRVSVFSGAVLGELEATSDATCSLASLPEGGLITSISCGSGPETSDCGRSEFGQVVLTANLDGKGGDEIVVGAPKMTVRGVSEVGAVLVYDAEGKWLDTQVLSSASQDAHFGSAIVRVAQKERDVLVVGAPGNQTTSIAYCASVMGTDVSPRCE